MGNMFWYVVLITHKGWGWLTDRKNLTSPKIICWITPVIYVIIEWTVDTVKLLNNVVVGTGQSYV